MTRWVLLLLFGFLAGRLSTLRTDAPQGVAISGDGGYVLTVDAGSTGTRLHVHKWSAGDDSDPVFHFGSEASSAVPNLKLSPGLSTFAVQVRAGDLPAEKRINRILDQLLAFAQKNVPEEFWSTTPLFFKATAGLRGVSFEQADKLLALCRRRLQQSKFLFKPKWATVASGRDEGVMGWVSLNYLLGSFSTNQTVGLLELGGASLQLAMQAGPHDTEDDHRLTKVTVFGRDYLLFVHSFADFGLEAAQDRLIRRGIELKLFYDSSDDNESSMRGEEAAEEEHIVIRHPCYPPGYSAPFEHTFQVVGTGDFDACVALVDEVLLSQHSHIQTPRIDAQLHRMVAVENFFHTAEFFGLTHSKDLAADLSAVGRVFCATDLEALRAEHPPQHHYAMLRGCFASAFISRLMSPSHAFNIEAPHPHVDIVRDVVVARHFRTRKTEINEDDEVNVNVAGVGVSVDWTLGSAILEVSDLLRLNDLHRQHIRTVYCYVAGLTVCAVLFAAATLSARTRTATQTAASETAGQNKTKTQ
ncbi:MAG: hypothetical protein MHM6MM_004726 [Cercozoa sp. M6MM]